MSRITPWALAPTPSHPLTSWRPRAARALRCLGFTCMRLARRWAHAPVSAAPGGADAHLEFHAEAGAPEGALFVDGKRVGTLAGITRL